MRSFTRTFRMRALRTVLTKGVLVAVLVVAWLPLGGQIAAAGSSPAIITVYPVGTPRGLMVTTGGWPYCLQLQTLARRERYTLACGRYWKDGYLGYGLRSKRHLDWGDPAYLAAFARKIADLHHKIGGELVLVGVSYSGFGVATLASHHPELRPSRVIVIDSFLDLVARRSALPPKHPTAREIDAETGGTLAALSARTVSVPGLAQLVASGTRLIVIWSTSTDEQVEFGGATCDRTADASVLAALAKKLGRPVPAWVTKSRHGHDLWDRGRAIIAGRPPGHKVIFQPTGQIPPGSTCA
jgi:pimeloyl-ACP methyl ester carboxylesterase